MSEFAQAAAALWLEEHGDHLFRFALIRVKNDIEVAEDLVQETLLAALQTCNPVEGPSAERRWMMGILKHKIIDHFRRSVREPLLDADARDWSRVESHEVALDSHWKPETYSSPEWPDGPDRLLDRKQFREALAACLDKLPERTAQVFTMREIDEMETDDICRLLGISPTNFGVILYRARRQLRDCLNHRYFSGIREGQPS